jgi:hypothetical protein
MTTAFTIVTYNYLAHAKCLGDSLLSKNPKFTFCICLIGDRNEISDISYFSNFKILDSSQLEPEDFSKMRERYNDFELSCALKPFFSELLFEKLNPGILLYFDADIMIFNSLELSEKILEKSSIVLTPHCLVSNDVLGAHTMDLMLLKYGVFNAGFYGMRKSAISDSVIQWWKDKMRTECITDLENGRYVDQIWLNLFPIYFNEVESIKDVGYNMAIWNMNEREITTHEDSILINHSRPLVFFHFSGYDFDVPDVLSKNHNIYSFESRPDVESLFKLYRLELEANDVRKYRNKASNILGKLSGKEMEENKKLSFPKQIFKWITKN